MGVIVAIDGPAGAGKSTVARLAAERLGFALVDTGAIYRCVALAARRAGQDWGDGAKVAALAVPLKITFQLVDKTNHVFLDGADVSADIRTPEMSRGASTVSAHPEVRAALLELQRGFARSEPRGAVLEGRDIGTVVFPDAPVKIFLTASAEERARRRFEELRAKGSGETYEAVLADQIRRDHDDSTRAVAPLKPAADAILLDTTGLGVEAVVARIVEAARQAGG